MKKIFLKIASLCGLLLIFSGCNSANYFDISSAMESPINESEQKNILSCAKDYMGEDVRLKYSLYKGKYLSCIISDFEASDLQGENCALLFCGKPSNLSEIHILFLKKSGNKWDVLKDIRHMAVDVEKVYIQDVDSDGSNEFAFVLKGLDKKRDSVYTYRYKNGNVEKINIPQQFFNNFKDTE